ncbi:MAG: hypothetical protein JO202_06230, partial [Ktedonobacteraceae bacterium]|nr:hypothetical protein [Ktedonobacteraceae bacterium]
MPNSSAIVRDALAQLGVPREEITPAASLLNDLSVDSTELIELITIIEQQIGTHIDEKQLKNVRIVAELVSFVDNYNNQMAG